MLEVLEKKNCALCRELTKKFEEFIRGTIREVLIWAKESMKSVVNFA